MWFNNFIEFERRQKGTNNLVLNFYSLERRKSVKVRVPVPVRIPTGFLPPKVIEDLEQKLSQDPELKQYPFTAKKYGWFSIGELSLPHNLELIHKLPFGFQTRNYDKLLRFGGFYPDRKAELSPNLEKRFEDEEELDLESLEDVKFGGFLTRAELEQQPRVYLDIEKPLWKKDDEKELLDERDKLLKAKRKYERKYESKKKNNKTPEEQEKDEHLLRLERISEIEKKLTTSLEGVGEVKLYDERFNADISFVTTVWSENGRETREMYVIDPNDEMGFEEYGGYKLLKFKTEKELIKGLKESFHQRRPLISIGHNQVYDYSQLTLAGEHHKERFDPSVKEVKPRRDMVVSFIQRLRQETIYLDTLWENNILAGHLKQKSFGTSLKLGAVANYRGIDFAKSLTHEQLREVELRRLAGQTREIRAKAIEDMLFYASMDVDITKEIAEKTPFLDLLVAMKGVLPFATLTEIAFSPNCMNKLHEFLHFQKNGNLPYHGYKTKQREDEKQIFKKRFPALKKRRLEKTAEFSRVKGEHEDIDQYYFSLEESLRDFLFSLAPELRRAYATITNLPNPEEKREQLRGFVQYLKVFGREPFTDYYFARRDGAAYGFTVEFAKSQGLSGRELDTELITIDDFVNRDLVSKLLGSFKYMKNHFRSLYVALEGPERKVIRPLENNLAQLSFPKIAQRDVDLYLLRQNAAQVSGQIKEGSQRVLKAFLTNFEKFEEYCNQIGKIITRARTDCKLDSFSLLYTYLYRQRLHEEDRGFEKKYGLPIKTMNFIIKRAYRDLAEALRTIGTVVDFKGDYLFINPNQENQQSQHPINIPNLHRVRHLPSYRVE